MKMLALPGKTLAQLREEFTESTSYRNPELNSQNEQPDFSGPVHFRFKEKNFRLNRLQPVSLKGEFLLDDDLPAWRIIHLQDAYEQTEMETVFFSPVHHLRHVQEETGSEDMVFRLGRFREL